MVFGGGEGKGEVEGEMGMERGGMKGVPWVEEGGSRGSGDEEEGECKPMGWRGRRRVPLLGFGVRERESQMML
jgi:hypothetical protein